jgi:hypothetical protein
MDSMQAQDCAIAAIPMGHSIPALGHTYCIERQLM